MWQHEVHTDVWVYVKLSGYAELSDGVSFSFLFWRHGEVKGHRMLEMSGRLM